MYVNPKYIYDKLIAGGMSKEHAIGAVNNVEWESSFNPASVNTEGDGEIGLWQWNGDRRTKLKEYAAGKDPKVDWTDVDTQIEFMLSEADTKLYMTRKFASAAEASYWFTYRWERPDNKEYEAKKRLATLPKYVAVAGMPPGSGGSVADWKADGPGTYDGPDKSGRTPGADGSVPEVIAQESDKLKFAKSALTGIKEIFVDGTGITRSLISDCHGGNVLDQFSSFNTIVTLSCLSSTHVNFPEDTYKAGDYGIIICRSGGGFPDNRIETGQQKTATTISEKIIEKLPESMRPGNRKFEYYLDNLNFTHNGMSYDNDHQGVTEALISFDVYEPYSMGIFMETLSIAAVNMGHINVADAVFLLTVEFIGYDENGEPVPVADELNRHIPIYLSNVEYTVTAAGSTYNLTGISLGNFVGTAGIAKIAGDMTITGSTVAEVLQSGEASLQYRINAELEYTRSRSDPPEKEVTTPKPASPEAARDDQYKPRSSKIPPDEIAIIFPKPEQSSKSLFNPITEAVKKGVTATVTTPFKAHPLASASVGSKQRGRDQKVQPGASRTLVQDVGTLNDIGKSKIETVGTAGPPVKDSDVRRPGGVLDRSKIATPDETGTFKFRAGTDIIHIITEIVLNSEYCQKSAMDPDLDDDGMIPWFKIETQTYYIENKSGADLVSAKLAVFRVIPYRVNPLLLAPNSKSPISDEELKKRVCRKYNYIYTGKNNEILDFSFEKQFMQTAIMYSDVNSLGQGTQTQLKGATIEKGQGALKVQSPEVPEAPNPMGFPKTKIINNRLTYSGGGGNDSIRTNVSKFVHHALMTNVSAFVMLELTIMGDPYFLADSGLGNWQSVPVSPYMMENGSMNYHTGPVLISVDFRTPIDYDEDTGNVIFSSNELVRAFSGLYEISGVENIIEKGNFKQKLSLKRRTIESSAEPSATSDGKPMSSDPEKTEPNTSVGSKIKGAFQKTFGDMVDIEFPGWFK